MLDAFYVSWICAITLFYICSLGVRQCELPISPAPAQMPDMEWYAVRFEEHGLFVRQCELMTTMMTRSRELIHAQANEIIARCKSHNHAKVIQSALAGKCPTELFFRVIDGICRQVDRMFESARLSTKECLREYKREPQAVSEP